jgi:hypothetical protein
MGLPRVFFRAQGASPVPDLERRSVPWVRVRPYSCPLAVGNDRFCAYPMTIEFQKIDAR